MHIGGKIWPSECETIGGSSSTVVKHSFWWKSEDIPMAIAKKHFIIMANSGRPLVTVVLDLPKEQFDKTFKIYILIVLENNCGSTSPHVKVNHKQSQKKKGPRKCCERQCKKPHPRPI